MPLVTIENVGIEIFAFLVPYLGRFQGGPELDPGFWLRAKALFRTPGFAHDGITLIEQTAQTQRTHPRSHGQHGTGGQPFSSDAD